MNDLKNQTNFEINEVINQPYKYGFVTNIEKENFPSGLNESIITLLSTKKKEPAFLLNFRLKAYKKWLEMKLQLLDLQLNYDPNRMPPDEKMALDHKVIINIYGNMKQTCLKRCRPSSNEILPC